MKTPIQNLFIALALLASIHQAAATVLLSDNFDNNLLDGAKWTTITNFSTAGYGTPQVIATNQRVEITARGYLNTVTNYDPSAPGGLLITGTWTFLNSGAGDTPSVVTRSSGAPTAWGTASAEVTDGITFRIDVPPNLPQISILGWGGANVAGFNVISNTLNVAQGDTVNFSVTDDGTNLSFSVTKVGDPTSAASATATCTSHLAANEISFYNREYQNCSAGLDNVVVQTIPPLGPTLNIASVGTQSILFWPASGTNYFLQSITNLNSSNWVTVSDAVPVIAFTVTNTSPARFFRLQQQQ
jgi:hypothetical protein